MRTPSPPLIIDEAHWWRLGGKHPPTIPAFGHDSGRFDHIESSSTHHRAVGHHHRKRKMKNCGRLFSANRMHELPVIREDQIRDDLHFRVVRVQKESYIEQPWEVILDEAASRKLKWLRTWTSQRHWKPLHRVLRYKKDAREHLLPKLRTQTWKGKGGNLRRRHSKRYPRDIEVGFQEKQVQSTRGHQRWHADPTSPTSGTSVTLASPTR